MTDDRWRGIRRLAWTSAGATLVLIAMGGGVRATDSGLACPDWPACYGQWVPPADFHMWMEHSHRLWAGAVGLLIAWLTVWTFRRRDEARTPFRLSAVAAALVLVQSGLGAAVVLLHLRAGLVTSHLGMSFVIVACLVAIALRSRPSRTGPIDATERHVGRSSALAAGAVLLQSLLGGQATGRGAAYVYNAVPIWFADDAWTGHVRQVLHVTHRAAGYLVAIGIVVLAAYANRRARGAHHVGHWVRSLPLTAAALVLVQVGLGITNVLTQATVWSAIGHLAVASWLWTVLVVAAVRGASTPIPPPVAPAPRTTPFPDTTEVPS